MEDLLQKAMIELIQQERYYAEFILNSTRKFTTDIPTLGVNVTDNINFYFNPHFWNNHSLLEQVAFLKHECDHVLKNHFGRFKDLEPKIFETIGNDDIISRIEKMQEFSILNAAADYATNEYLKSLPKKVNFFNPDGSKVLDPDTGKPVEGNLLFVEDLQKEDKSVLNNQHMEYYYEYLKKRQKEGKGKGDGTSTLDDHSIWAQGNNDIEYIAEKIKQTANKAMEATVAAGEKVGDHILKDLHKLNNRPKDWKNDLQRFVAKAIEIVSDSSRKVRNRRYGLLYPGHKSYPKLVLAVAIDTSGSVYDDMLYQFITEIGRIHKNGAKVVVIQADTIVHSIEDFDPKVKFTVKGRGGTAFQPTFNAAAELDVDGLIYLTDGENFDIKEVVKPKYPVMWALPPGCKVAYDWGMKTTVTIKKIG